LKHGLNQLINIGHKMFDLTNKIALVTGATGGIGEAIARALHHQGATVAVTGRRSAQLNMLKSELGERIHTFTCDLSNAVQAQSIVDQVIAQLGNLHIVVNNAGLTKDNLIIRMKDSDLDDVLDVNLKAPFYIMRAAAKYMMRARVGRIINISSIVGVSGNPGQVNYCASKAGLIGATKALAQEVAARNVTVNAIAPGFIASSMTHDLPEAVKAKLLGSIPLGQMGHVDDIATATIYLASDEAKYITGQTLHINGGMLMV